MLAEADAIDAKVATSIHPQPIIDRLLRRAADLRALAATLHDRKVTPSMDADQERREIRAAMDRLMTGRPLRTTGALTVVGLAEEANLKRHVLTHGHTDLKDEFNARVRAQHHVPPQLAAAHDKNRALQHSGRHRPSV